MKFVLRKAMLFLLIFVLSHKLSSSEDDIPEDASIEDITDDADLHHEDHEDDLHDEDHKDDTAKDEGKRSRTSSRQPRILSTLAGLGGINVIGTNNRKLLDIRTRIDTLLMKINSFEKMRAKLVDIKPLLNLLKKLSNICPPNTNSLQVGSKCYEHQINNWMDYISASIYCKSRGGTLARPNVTDSQYLEKLRNVFPNLGDESVLVGITDIEREGFFKFLDGTPVSSDRFNGGTYPINHKEDCVSLIYVGGFGLTDTTCKRLHQVLCEYDLVNLLPYPFRSIHEL